MVASITFSMIGAVLLYHSFAKKAAQENAYQQLSASAQFVGTLLESQNDRLNRVLENALELNALGRLLDYDASTPSKHAETARLELETELIGQMESNTEIVSIEFLSEIGERIVAVGDPAPPVDDSVHASNWFQATRSHGHHSMLIDSQRIRVSRAGVSDEFPSAVATMTYELSTSAQSAFAIATHHLEQCEVRILDNTGTTLFVDRELPIGTRTIDAFSPIPVMNCAVSISQPENRALLAYFQARTSLYFALLIMVSMVIVVACLARRHLNGQARAADESQHVLRKALESSKLELKQAADQLAIRDEELAASKKHAEAANRSKTAFIANVSQELRTPLTSIIGYAEILLKDAALSKTTAANIGPLATIHQHGKYVTRIIDDILDLSRIESRKVRLDSAHFSITKLLTDIESKMRSRAEKKASHGALRSIRHFPTQLQPM